MKWYITTTGFTKDQKQNAGEKAPKDIAEICWHLGMKALRFQPFPCKLFSNLYKKIWLLTIGTFPWLKMYFSVHMGDIILYQHPMYGNRLVNQFIPFIKKYKKCKFIALVHDLDSLRKGNEGANYIADNILLKQFDVIICHNSAMKKYLISQGFRAENVICLKMFDYLSSCHSCHDNLSPVPSIAIAGNLNPQKSKYIYQINYPQNVLEIHLYGVGFNENMASNNMNYHGSFEPEDLPDHLVGDFGLVWDGCSVETCAGNTGEYLKYNNPHKVSLYLASNMPVIVWKKSALADYVCKKNLGFTVNSLDEIPGYIRTLKPEEYNKMCEAVREEGQKIRSGYYTRQALKRAYNLLER